MVQVIKQTDEELMSMYMKLDKEELIKMLIQANKVIECVCNPPVFSPLAQPTHLENPFWQIPLNTPPYYQPDTITCQTNNHDKTN